MEVKLDKSDIIKEIQDSHLDDVQFLYEIVYEGTESWASLKEVAKLILEKLQSKKEIDESLDIDDILS